MEIRQFEVAGNKDTSGSAFARVEDKSRPQLRGIIIEDISQRHAEKALIEELSNRIFGGEAA